MPTLIPVRNGGAGALGLTNALGNVQWAYTLETASWVCPAVPPMLAAMWGAGVVHLHIAQLSGLWSSLPTYGSLLQVGLEGHPMFRVVLRAAISQRVEILKSRGRV